MSNPLKLREPVDVSPRQIERALAEAARAEPSIARSLDAVRGAAAQRAAGELNRVLDIDLFELLAEGWSKVRSVRNALQLSELMPGPPVLVRLEQHHVTSTLIPVLRIDVGDDTLPELRFSLELVVGMQGATLAARHGRIELLGLGTASVVARLACNDVLLKQHATLVEGPADPFKPDAEEAEPAIVDQL